MQFINLQGQYQAYKKELDEAIHKILDSSSYIMGEENSLLEEELAKYLGVKYAIGASSGTSALEIANRAIGLKEGDEVITTPFTFFASASMISITGAKPIFVDIEKETYNIDPEKIEKAITPKTKAIVVVSLYGQTPDMDRINEIAKKHNLIVIEDAAQSFGATYKGKKSCNLSEVSTTSFFPSKPLGCYGDGGAIFTNNKEIADKMKLYMNHGQNKRYSHSLIGLNGRLDTMQAAILRVKLRHLDKELKRREEVAKIYSEALKDYCQVPIIKDDRTSAFAQYTILVDSRDKFMKDLDGIIPLAVHYPIPLYKQEVYKYMNLNKDDFEVTEDISQRVVSLPFSPFISDEEISQVVDNVKRVLS